MCSPISRKTNPKLSSKDLAILRKMIDASLQIAAQLYEDIRLTRELYNLILDWIEALSAAMARQHWCNHPAKPENRRKYLSLIPFLWSYTSRRANLRRLFCLLSRQRISMSLPLRKISARNPDRQ